MNYLIIAKYDQFKFHKTMKIKSGSFDPDPDLLLPCCALISKARTLRGKRLHKVSILEYSNATYVVLNCHPGLIETIRGTLMMILHSILTFEFVR
jgi:hypothetical protein